LLVLGHPIKTHNQQPATDNRSVRRALIIILLVLCVDQAVKFYVKTHFYSQEQVPVFGAEGTKAFIHFTENNGMAFGMELFRGGWGKLFLSLFRILAVAGIGWYLWELIKRGAHKGLIAAIAFVFAGALGNILDSCFYGLIFDSSCDEVTNQGCGEIAKAFTGHGYAGFLHGKVVDMFYFPLYEGHFPQWFPKWGGEAFTFFSPVFNVADSSITIGVFMIIIFQKRFFGKKKQEENVAGDNTTSTLTTSSTESIPPVNENPSTEIKPEGNLQ
jgi:signal peptidase II